MAGQKTIATYLEYCAVLVLAYLSLTSCLPLSSSAADDDVFSASSSSSVGRTADADSLLRQSIFRALIKRDAPAPAMAAPKGRMNHRQAFCQFCTFYSHVCDPFLVCDM